MPVVIEDEDRWRALIGQAWARAFVLQVLPPLAFGFVLPDRGSITASRRHNQPPAMTNRIPARSPFPLRALALAGLASAWSVALPAQGQTYVACPQDTTTGAWGNYGPLGGVSPAPGGEECRMQMVIPAAFLPSVGAKIVAIDVIATTWSTTFTANYEMLDISMDHLVSPSAFPALSSTFAANLTAPSVVLALRNQAVTYPSGAWYRLPLTQPFVYNGSGHLVVEFKKILQATLPGNLYMVTSRDERTDLPATVITIDIKGSGAWNRSVATGSARPFRMRFVFEGTSSLTNVLKSDMLGTTYWGLGTQMTMSVQGLPNVPVWQAIDFSSAGLTSRPTPFTSPVLLGKGWVYPGPLLVLVPAQFIPANGVLTNALTIPTDPALINKQLIFQAVLAEPGRGLTWSSATDVTLK